ncbi:Coiled-coil domain-containing protein 158 [Tupaia chinensis]|uniref:Coiled-coil domain-containing protein 158 n=1 Tax=Tupaia chinensis TaxID=246437 RepID=L9L697_TUPCH|nr:Coiled-coil domain-containing protein 158 [Tupaia chinensis]
MQSDYRSSCAGDMQVRKVFCIWCSCWRFGPLLVNTERTVVSEEVPPSPPAHPRWHPVSAPSRHLHKPTMKVAMGMQKQITAKRGQIDALQSKIQFLEEAMTNANKEKHFLKEEKSKLSQELTTIATEKNKMAGELEVLRSQERRLKEKVANMEVALDKELQGPGYTSNSSVKPRLLQPSSVTRSHSNVASSQSTASFLSHHSMKPNTLKEDPTRDLKQLLQELRSVINEEPAVPLNKTENDGRTPSLGALEPVTLHAGDMEDPSCCFTFQPTASPSVKNSASRSFTSSPKKSPVHSLLTSSAEESVGSASQYRSTKPVHSPDSVKAMSSMIRNQEKRIQKVKDQEKMLLK